MNLGESARDHIYNFGRNSAYISISTFDWPAPFDFVNFSVEYNVLLVADLILVSISKDLG